MKTARTNPVVYFRCRICGGIAVFSGNDGRRIHCRSCGFSETAGAQRPSR